MMRKNAIRHYAFLSVKNTYTLINTGFPVFLHLQIVTGRKSIRLTQDCQSQVFYLYLSAQKNQRIKMKFALATGIPRSRASLAICARW